MVRGNFADADLEAIAVQMAGLELVAMPAGAQDPEAVAIELPDLWLGRRRYGDPLPGDCVPVLHAGRANVVGPDTETLGDLAHEELRSEIAFLDPEIKVLPLAAWLVRG